MPQQQVTDVGWNVGDAIHGTTTADVVADVTLDEDYEAIEVLNRGNGVGGAVADLFCLIDPGATDPTVAGQRTRVVPAPAGSSLVLRSPAGATSQVKLIASGAVAYTVTGLRV